MSDVQRAVDEVKRKYRERMVPSTVLEETLKQAGSLVDVDCGTAFIFSNFTKRGGPIRVTSASRLALALHLDIGD